MIYRGSSLMCSSPGSVTPGGLSSLNHPPVATHRKIGTSVKANMSTCDSALMMAVSAVALSLMLFRSGANFSQDLTSCHILHGQHGAGQLLFFVTKIY